MPRTSENFSGRLREDFVRNLRLDFFDEDEIAAVLEDLDTLDAGIRQKAFALCYSLSQAGSSLLPNTLRRIKTAEGFLEPEELELWLGQAYDIFDHRGLGALIDFMSRTDEEALLQFRQARGLALKEVLSLLETYLKGISGLDLKISASADSYTDTSTVYLRAFEDTFGDRARNFLIYKFRVAHAWAQIACGSLTPDIGTMELLKDRSLSPGYEHDGHGHPDISSFFRPFAERRMALHIYIILEALRLEGFLQNALPGLMREVAVVKQDLLAGRLPSSGLPEKMRFMESLYQFFLSGGPGGPLPVDDDVAGELLSLKKKTTTADSIKILLRLYDIASRLKGDYLPEGFEILLGSLRPEEVSLALKAGRRARKQRVEGMITRLLEMPDFEPQKMPARGAGKPGRQPEPGKEYLIIKGRVIELDSEMREALEERGGIPGGIIVKGADTGGSASPLRLEDLVEEEGEQTAPPGEEGGIYYDEWDYRRGGYKKKWCILREKNIHPGHEPFVETTIRRYSGYIRVLRKKFELLRREPKTLRRQRDGDDIDLDAMVDAFSDIRAGLPPDENLLTRYDRQERNIAVLFLLDMSGSTKGWINEAEKESLVMMAEALEALGDRYAIFGFSGMKRNNCEFYRVKGFDEPYGDTVKRRISGIEPRDYTRMGPAIRHSAGILRAVEARTRLFITLSDGRPEDYDDYKGDYAIEDTRKALAEAKEMGIHSFCITIDRDAGQYLRRLYGEVNYIVIDDVKKLPSRITEIYRRLTA